MTAFSLTNGVDTITPWDRIGFESHNQPRTIVHDLLNGDIAVSIIPPRPRSGPLLLLFAEADDAETARQALLAPAVWTVTDPVPAINGLRFVVSDDISPAQQDDRSTWLLNLGYQEVPA